MLFESQPQIIRKADVESEVPFRPKHVDIKHIQRIRVESLARRRSLYAPIDVDLFSSNAEMLATNDIADLVEQFALVRRGSSGYVLGHTSQYENYPSRKQP